MKTLSWIAVGLLMAVATVPATAADWKADYAKHWTVSKEFTMAVASAMPAEDYGFKPNPEEMSFGEVMVHIVQADMFYLGRVANMKALDKPAATDKDATLKFMAAAFDFCDQALSKINNEMLDSSYGKAPNQMTGKESLWSGFTHMAHHRGQAEVYLRLKGIKPPAYRF